MRLMSRRQILGWYDVRVCICAVSVAFILGSCSSGAENDANQDRLAPIFRQDPPIREVLETSCFDCHSSEKPAAWSARLAPSYLFGADKARRVLNFSDWDTYDSQRKRTELEAIGKVVADSSMPPGDYDFVHPAAKLSGDQKQMLLQWVSGQVAVAH